MFTPLSPKHLARTAFLSASLACTASLMAVPGAASAKILWAGDFETGDFMQWHSTDKTRPNFSQMPEYCRPKGNTAYFGDGSCLSLDTTIVRQGKYSAKFVVKNSKNGSEPRDCDSNGDCSRRRTQLTAQGILPVNYNALPYMSERWLSFSVYIPSDWVDTKSDQGWGPVIYGVKPLNESGLSGIINMDIEDGSWVIWHRWDDKVNPSPSDVPWQQQMFYSATYPLPNGSDSGKDLRADFPDQAVSQKALGNLNKGGWTDWVIHIKFDARGSKSGGTGFLEFYKRENNGPWIKVLDIRPKVITRGGMTFDRGIGYNSPASGSNNGGFGLKAGLYMHKNQVWNLANNRVIYMDNIKVGDQNSSLAEMSPEGTVKQAPPSAPRLNQVQ